MPPSGEEAQFHNSDPEFRARKIAWQREYRRRCRQRKAETLRCSPSSPAALQTGGE